jgi:hypothetical protein
LGVETNTKIHGVQQNIGLVLIFNEYQGCWGFMKQVKADQ